MKDWMTIGVFAKAGGCTARALRLYEEAGLLRSHERGDNDYRYYKREQLEALDRILKFKSVGFSLAEIANLLNVDRNLDVAKLKTMLTRRRGALIEQQAHLRRQKVHLESILSSLQTPKESLGTSERRYIMSQFENASIVITGIKNLAATAKLVGEYLRKSNRSARVTTFKTGMALPSGRPFILIVPEKLLGSSELADLNPDVVVINNVSSSSQNLRDRYLSLYNGVGPHMTTVLNADDSISVKLAANRMIRKGKTFYYSKNQGLEDQISRIGGIVSDGQQMKVYGFNRAPSVISIDIPDATSFDQEISVLASIAAVLDIGLDRSAIGDQA